MTVREPVAEYLKDPDSTLDYILVWSRWLGTDTIASASWTVPAGLTEESSTATTTTATVWLSGGTAGTDYDVACLITTAAGRIDERTIRVRCRER
jgi:hypothetical protein